MTAVLKSSEEILEILRRRSFFDSDETRVSISNKLGGMKGLIKYEEKYKHDYFFFRLDGAFPSYTLPFGCVHELIN